MNANLLYLIGSLTLLIGALATHQPVYFVVASALFTLGSVVAIVKELGA